MFGWLDLEFDPMFEYPVGDGRRLDAALWFNNSDTDSVQRTAKMDIALEWEWDHNKVYKDFASGDFKKVVSDVDARCGIAIIQTRTDGRYVLTNKAEETLKRIRDSFRLHRHDDRPVGVIEIRRTLHEERHVAFVCNFFDLDSDAEIPSIHWSFSDQTTDDNRGSEPHEPSVVPVTAPRVATNTPKWSNSFGMEFMLIPPAPCRIGSPIT